MNSNENQKRAGGFFLTCRIIAKNLRPVVIGNAVTLVNAIFLVASGLLLVFKEAREGLFLGSVLVLNVVIGIVQDLRAKVALENYRYWPRRGLFARNPMAKSGR